jgi:hypothetical protein
MATLKRIAYSMVALAFTGVVIAGTSFPAGKFLYLPAFIAMAATVVGEWWLFWRPVERQELLQERKAHGQCADCGYDLVGNVSGVCPECGSAVPTDLKPGGDHPARGDVSRL